jgi:hypothetical protein
MIGKVSKFLMADIMELPSHWAEGSDMTFTDPPWEQGALTMFETLAFKKADLPRPGRKIDDVLAALFSLAPAGCPIFVEYGSKTFQRVVRIGVEHGAAYSKTMQSIQSNGSPFVVVEFNSDIEPPSVMKGYSVLMKAIATHKPSCIFEPFAGTGRHAAHMIGAGVDVIASELNPHAALKFVAKLL